MGKDVAARGATIGTIALVFAGQALANGLHAGSYFHLLPWVGSVTCGVVKGLQAGCVFILATVFFCGVEGLGNNCFTVMKGISLVIVLIGIGLYTYASALKRRAAEALLVGS